MGTVKRHSECQPAHEECKGDGDDRHLPYEMDRNVDRKGSRWCVVRDARHTHKTQARCRLLPGDPTQRAQARPSAERGISGSGERTLAQASFVSGPAVCNQQARGSSWSAYPSRSTLRPGGPLAPRGRVPSQPYSSLEERQKRLSRLVWQAIADHSRSGVSPEHWPRRVSVVGGDLLVRKEGSPRCEGRRRSVGSAHERRNS